MKDMDKLDMLEIAFLKALHDKERFGKANCMPRTEMAWRIATTKRDVQNVYDRLVMDHHVPVRSYDGKGGGYCLPPKLDELAKEELNDVCKRMTKRALKELYHQSVLKRSSFAQEAVQLTFSVADEYRKQEAAVRGIADFEVAVPDSMNVVKQVFTEVAAHPEKYIDELEYAHKQWGGILVTNEMAEKLVAIRNLLNSLIPEKAA